MLTPTPGRSEAVCMPGEGGRLNIEEGRAVLAWSASMLLGG